MRPRILFTFLLLVVATAFACAERKVPPPSLKVEPVSEPDPDQLCMAPADEAAAAFCRAWAFEQAGNGQEALPLYRQFLDTYPENPLGIHACIAIGADLLAAEKYDEARLFFTRPCARYHGSRHMKSITLGLAQSLLHTGHYQTAADHFRQLLERTNDTAATDGGHDANLRQQALSGFLQAVGEGSITVTEDDKKYFDEGGHKDVYEKLVREQAASNRGIPKDVIAKVIRSNYRPIRLCYQRELNEDVRLEGKVSVSFTIGSDGLVTNTSIKVTTMNNEKVERCVQDVIRKIVFPKPAGGGQVVVTYPFIFRSESV